MDILRSGKRHLYFKYMVKGVLADCATLEVTLRRGEGVSYVDTWEEAHFRWMDSKCKGPEVGRACLLSKEQQGGQCACRSDENKEEVWLRK